MNEMTAIKCINEYRNKFTSNHERVQILLVEQSFSLFVWALLRSILTILSHDRRAGRGMSIEQTRRGSEGKQTWLSI